MAWRSLFEGIANDSMPPYFEVKEGYMIFRYASKFKQTEIPGDVRQAFLVLQNFILVNGGPISSQDAVVKVISKPLSWARIKNNPKKLNMYIRMYSQAVCAHYRLSQEKQERLHIFLISNIRSGRIGDVRVNEHAITSIPQLSYDPSSETFHLQPGSNCAVRKPASTKKTCSSKWKTFTEEMNVFKADILLHLMKK